MRIHHFTAVVAVSSLALGGAACTGHTAPVTRTTTRTVTATVTATATATVTQQQHTVITVAPPTQAPADAVGDVVTGSGSALAVPAARVTKTYVDDAYSSCHGLTDAGFYVEGCTLALSAAGAAIGIVETSGTTEHDLVYTVHGSTATLALRGTRAVPPPQGEYPYNADAARVLTDDLALDNTPKLVFYMPVFSRTYVTAFESVDVVEATGHLVLHRDLGGGIAARAFGGGLETWVPIGARVERDVIQWRSNAWRITSADVVSKDEVPTSTASL